MLFSCYSYDIFFGLFESVKVFLKVHLRQHIFFVHLNLTQSQYKSVLISFFVDQLSQQFKQTNKKNLPDQRQLVKSKFPFVTK